MTKPFAGPAPPAAVPAGGAKKKGPEEIPGLRHFG